MATPMHRVKARLPRRLLAAASSVGAALGYLLVRREADRVADQLNSSLVESLAYIGRRLDDFDGRIGRPRPELAFVIAAVAGLEPGAQVRVECDFEDVAARLRWLGYEVTADSDTPSATIAADPRRLPAARPGALLVLATEGTRRPSQQWARALHGWRIETLTELVPDPVSGWRRAAADDKTALTLIAASA